MPTVILSKTATPTFDVEKFDLKKLNDVIMEQYLVKM